MEPAFCKSAEVPQNIHNQSRNQHILQILQQQQAQNPKRTDNNNTQN